jgi:hypothetical protein
MDALAREHVERGGTRVVFRSPPVDREAIASLLDLIKAGGRGSWVSPPTDPAVVAQIRNLCVGKVNVARPRWSVRSDPVGVVRELRGRLRCARGSPPPACHKVLLCLERSATRRASFVSESDNGCHAASAGDGAGAPDGRGLVTRSAA